MRDIEFSLIGHPAAEGQLLAADAVSLCTAMRTLILRLTREAVAQFGLGRPLAAVEAMAQVRLAIPAGGTRMVFTIGDDALFDPVAEMVDDRFVELVEAVAVNTPPRELSPTVGDAVAGLVSAFRHAAGEVRVRIGSETRLETAQLLPTVWRIRAAPTEDRELVGTLEAVDLASRRFRLRDDEGLRIDLDEVQGHQSAAHLIGLRVVAEGVYVPPLGNARARLAEPVVRLAAPRLAAIGD